MFHEPPSSPPQRLGRYTIVRRLGAGGMAEVYLARSRGAEGIDKLLVVKRILPGFAANGRFRAMFVDEARIAMRLNHPNIVQVFGFEADGPTLLLVMEYVDGPDLSTLASAVHRAGERFAPAMVAWIVREVARGLLYAHERRDEAGTPLEIVHRDVSPGNILTSFDGQVKLGDFGIARARLSTGEDENTIKGKFSYMSPEQARTEVVDPRADVYSLGVVALELLTGRPVFDRQVSSSQELLTRLRRGEVPDVGPLRGEVPDELFAIVKKQLSPKAADRQPSARALAQELTRFLRTMEREWDGTTLELLVGRFFSRPTSGPLPPPIAEESPKHSDAATVVQARPTNAPSARENTGAATRESRPAMSGGLAEEASLMRERLHVTVLVGRIVAPADATDTIDTRPVYDLLNSLAFKSDALLERAEDGRFQLVLGALRSSVDHGLHAARLALDLRDDVASLRSEGEGEGVSVALGVARGLAAVGRGSEGSVLGVELVDDAVRLASALAESAEPGEILLTPAVYRLVRRTFLLREAASRPGLAPNTFRLERPKNRAEREAEAEALHAELVGRGAELLRLDDALARIEREGRGSAMLVTGELGIGKSALCAAWSQRLTGNVAVLRVSLVFGVGEHPWRCVAAVLAELMGLPEQELDDGALVTAAIERAVAIAAYQSGPAQRAARRALHIVAGLEQDEGGGEAATARELVLLLRRLLAARSLLNPVALLIDGVEHADRQSRMVLRDLGRRPPPGPMLLVFALRDTDPLLQDLAGVEQLVLPPLPEPARHQLVAQRLGTGDLAPELLREVSAVAGGNPLMLLEVIEALGDRGRLEVVTDDKGRRVVFTAAREGELPLPATLEEVLAARLDALPTDARTLARWCALLGTDAPVEVLDAVAGEEATPALQRLLAGGILVHAPGSRDTVTFAHAALARVARASIDPTRVAAMHARIAAVLERRPEARGIGAVAVARHREAAGAFRPAARAFLEAAGAHRQLSHFREAMDAYSRVLELTAGSTDAESFSLRFAGFGGREEIARVVGLGRVRHGEVVALRQVAIESRDPRLLVRALVRQARYKQETGMGEGIERDVSSAVRMAQRTGELRTESEAQRVLAMWLGQRGRYAEALLAIDRALGALEQRGASMAPPGGSAEDGVRAARVTQAECLLTKGTLLRQTGAIEDAMAVYADAWALVSRHGPQRLLGHVFNNLGVACFSRGNYGDALRLYLASIAVQREHGLRDRLGMALSNAGQAWAALGNVDSALQYLRKSVEVYTAVGARAAGKADAHGALAELHAQRGELDFALVELERGRIEAEVRGDRYDLVRVKLAESAVALARGDARGARQAAERAAEVADGAGILYGLHARAMVAEAAALQGDGEAARRYLDAVLADPKFIDPARLERGDRVLASCERALRRLGENARADLLHALQQRRQAPRSTPGSLGA